MRRSVTSLHGEEFRHDDQAEGYDADVRNEEEPIRTGYAAALAWVGTRTGQGLRNGASILELGSGTGNLTALLPAHAKVTCVDNSQNMMDKARGKLGEQVENIRFCDEDLLAHVTGSEDTHARVVSTYAIHHLTESEREVLFDNCARLLEDDGEMVFADLMFEDAPARERVLQDFEAAGQPGVREGADEEFFWDIAAAREALARWGFEIVTERFSALTWGLHARRA